MIILKSVASFRGCPTPALATSNYLFERYQKVRTYAIICNSKFNCNFADFFIIKFKMAFLKEDSQYTHIIAIDFGTGASG